MHVCSTGGWDKNKSLNIVTWDLFEPKKVPGLVSCIFFRTNEVIFVISGALSMREVSKTTGNQINNQLQYHYAVINLNLDIGIIWDLLDHL